MKIKNKHQTFTVTEINNPKVRYFEVNNGGIIVSVVDDTPKDKVEQSITLYLLNPETQIAMGVCAAPLYHLIEVEEGVYKVDEEKGMVDVEQTIEEMIRALLTEDEDGDTSYITGLVMMDMMLDFMENGFDDDIDEDDEDFWDDEEDDDDSKIIKFPF